MLFERDIAKAETNRARHGVDFPEAATVFLDPLALTFDDPDHGLFEAREITIGHTVKQQSIFVSYCLRGKQIRLISARLAT